MVEVVVEYEYEAAHEDELTLRQGDIIKNVRRIEEDGWMEGDLNGRRGLFPDNFVKELRKEPKEDTKEAKEPKDVKEAKEAKEVKEETPLQRRSAGNVASLVQRISTYGIPTGGLGLQPRASKKKPKKRHCKVLFEYVPQNEDELELKVGDIIDITEEVEEGWWNGTINGKSGLFPSNFVKEIEMSEEAESNEVSDEPEPKEDPTSPISPHPGNGVIPQPKKVRGVGFGDIFREGSVKLKPHQPSESEEKKEKPVPSLPPTAKPTHASTSEPQKVEKDAESKAKAKQYCRVTFAYVSSTDDELDLKEGDIIQVLSKDTGEPGWWRGELNGKTGVFPDNFVTLISDSEKETVVSKGSIKQSARPESEEKPKKPPPPSKVSKSEVTSAEKKLPPPWSEDKVDKAVPDKPAKPSAPTVPPKKPVPPPGKGLLRPGSLHPKRPDKPLVPSPVAKHNGEVSHLRPKSDFEPTLPSKQKTMSGDWSEKPADSDLMIFDDVSTTSEKLSHPTANRPKMPGRRLPAQFGGGQSPNKEVSEKAQKTEEDDAPRLKPSELRRSSSSSHSALKPVIAPTPEPKARPGVEVQKEKEKSGELDDLRTQMKELVLTIELLKAQQTKELAELRNELDEERLKRLALQMEIEKLKKQVQST